MTRPLKRAHHFLPQFYLRAWSDDGQRVSRYRLLVRNEGDLKWDRPRIPSLAMRRDLYTSTATGADSDEMETWFDREVESPAAPLIRRLLAGERLKAPEWVAVTRFVLALEGRTPLAYMRWRERTIANADELLRNTLARLPSILVEHQRFGYVRGHRPQPDHRLPLRVTRTLDEATGKTAIGAEVTVGRELWLWSIRHSIEETIWKFRPPPWVVLTPAEGQEWFTSDHPVVRLAYNSSSDYNFEGGWGRKGCEVLLPIGPRALLYCKIGHPPHTPTQASPALTFGLQEVMALHASRAIIARQPISRIERFIPRRVDALAWEEEAKVWEAFHQDQTEGHRWREPDGPVAE